MPISCKLDVGLMFPSMKTTLLLAVLAALAINHEASVVKSSTRANLNVGYIAAGDRLLHRQYLYRQAVINTIQSEDLIYRGNTTTRISAIQATEVGYTQYATPWIIAGGIGQSNVTIRVQSYRGYGYYYLIDIWGR